MKNVFRLVLVTVLLAISASAQHDLKRNEARVLARGKTEKAIRKLKKAQDQSESLFLLALAHSMIDDPVKALDYARTAVEAGLPVERFLAGPREATGALRQTAEFQQWAEPSTIKLIHGPMLGAVTDTTARFWVRTAREAAVQVVLHPSDDKRHTKIRSEVVRSSAEQDFTAIVRVQGLQPDTAYAYRMKVGNEAVTEPASFRTYPEEGRGGEFTVGFGGGAGYVPKHERMWQVIARHDPRAFLMLGDNVYIDDPKHRFTQRYCYYRRQSRPEWRHLVSQCSMYAIYDDHDFGTNDCVPGPQIERPAWKREVWNVFKQNWNNPFYGGGKEQPGCWHDFYIGDVHFIMLDCRYYRTLKGNTMLGPVQKKWLFRTLRNSEGTFKVIASSVPFAPGVKPGSKDPWDGYPAERREIFNFLADNDIEGVILLAADRHRSDVRTIKREDPYNLVEFESSRLTNVHTHGVVNTPGLIFGYNKKCSFGLLHFDTRREDPLVTFTIHTIDDRKVFEYKLSLNRLQSE